MKKSVSFTQISGNHMGELVPVKLKKGLPWESWNGTQIILQSEATARHQIFRS